MELAGAAERRVVSPAGRAELVLVEDLGSAGGPSSTEPPSTEPPWAADAHRLEPRAVDIGGVAKRLTEPAVAENPRSVKLQ